MFLNINNISKDVNTGRVHGKTQTQSNGKKHLNTWILNPNKKLEELAPKVKKEFYTLPALEKKLSKLIK